MSEVIKPPLHDMSIPKVSPEAEKIAIELVAQAEAKGACAVCEERPPVLVIFYALVLGKTPGLVGGICRECAGSINLLGHIEKAWWRIYGDAQEKPD